MRPNRWLKLCGSRKEGKLWGCQRRKLHPTGGVGGGGGGGGGGCTCRHGWSSGAESAFPKSGAVQQRAVSPVTNAVLMRGCPPPSCPRTRADISKTSTGTVAALIHCNRPSPPRTILPPPPPLPPLPPLFLAFSDMNIPSPCSPPPENEGSCRLSCLWLSMLCRPNSWWFPLVVDQQKSKRWVRARLSEANPPRGIHVEFLASGTRPRKWA